MSGGLSKHCFPSAAELSQSKDSLLPHVGTSKTPARSFKTLARGKHGNLRASQEFPSSTDCTCSGLSPSRAQETNKQKQLRSTPLISAKCQSFNGMIPNWIFLKVFSLHQYFFFCPMSRISRLCSLSSLNVLVECMMKLWYYSLSI